MNAKLGPKSGTPTSVKDTKRSEYSNLDSPLQNRPTSRNAKVLWDAGLDSPIAADVEIQGRWETSLLSGGTHGSVWLGQKKQKAHNAAATALETLKFYNRKADAMYHHTLEAHRLQDAVDLAIMQSEAEADAAGDATLGMIDPVCSKSIYFKTVHKYNTFTGSLLVNWREGLPDRG